MKIVVLGATGETGRRFCRRALDAGHAVSARSGSRTVIAGVHEVSATPLDLGRDEALREAFAGAEAVVSTLGGLGASRAGGVRAIVAAAIACGVRRVVAVGGAGVLEHPAGGLVREAPGYPARLRPISEDHLQSLEALQGSPLAWTLLCPGTMREGVSQGRYRHQAERALEGFGAVLYDDVAHLLLRCVEEDLYVRARVSIANP